MKEVGLLIHVAGYKDRRSTGILIEREYSEKPAVVGMSITAALVLSAVIVPPIMLINIPTLVSRAFLAQRKKDQHTEVIIEQTVCPRCEVQNSFHHQGSFPFWKTCPHCRIRISFSPEWLPVTEDRL